MGRAGANVLARGPALAVRSFVLLASPDAPDP